MPNRLRFAVYILALLSLSACAGVQVGGSGRSLTYGEDAEANYQAAYEAYEAGRCLDAEPQFRRIQRDFPYSGFAALSELGVGDCQLSQGQYTEAIQTYRRFIRFRPSHERVPYATFRVAEAFYEQIPSDWFLSPPSYERDLDATRRALQRLRGFVMQHGEDENAPRAREMIARALRLLAEHELYVARFYMERNAHEGAILRLRGLVTTYPGSGLEPEALLLLGELLRDASRTEEARQVLTELRERFPESSEADRASGVLSALPMTES